MTESDIHGHINLSECQIIQRNWEEDIGIDRSVYSRFRRAMEEWNELEDAVVNDESLRAVADEAADVIIIALGIVDVTGFDMEQVFLDKMSINWKKYPPDKVQRLMDNGMSNKEALAKCKEDWDKKAESTTPK